jgi:hypothetical protein
VIGGLKTRLKKQKVLQIKLIRSKNKVAEYQVTEKTLKIKQSSLSIKVKSLNDQVKRLSLDLENTNTKLEIAK